MSKSVTHVCQRKKKYPAPSVYCRSRRDSLHQFSCASRHVVSFVEINQGLIDRETTKADLHLLTRHKMSCCSDYKPFYGDPIHLIFMYLSELHVLLFYYCILTGVIIQNFAISFIPCCLFSSLKPIDSIKVRASEVFLVVPLTI